MKKLGTITAALGFIYLGVWMVFRNAESALAAELFKWWPILIVFLGVEILIYFGGRSSEEKVGFNFLVIVVLIIFIVINAVQFIGKGIGRGMGWIDKNINITNDIEFLNNINVNNYKVISSNTTLQPGGANINILLDNGDLRIKKSSDKNVKIEANVYVDKDFSDNQYNINAKKDNEGYVINMTESYIKKAEVYLYIPENYNIKVNSENVRIKSEDEVKGINYNIKASNGSIDLFGGNSLQLNFNNGSVKARDIKSVKIDSSNSSINLDGNIEDIDAKANNGAVNVNNKLCKNVNINLNLGAVKFNTEDKNVDLDIDIDHGPVDVNGTKRLNSSVKNTMGSGEGKVKIRMDNGTVSFKN